MLLTIATYDVAQAVYQITATSKVTVLQCRISRVNSSTEDRAEVFIFI